MKYPEFIKHILAGKFAPVYFFYGEETYFSEEAVRKISNKFVTKNTSEFNRDVFYGEDTDGAHIVNAAMSVPMMAQHRVVVVKNFHRLREKDKELVVKYARNPAPHSILILVADKVDLRKKVYAELKQLALTLECTPLYENQIASYVQQMVMDRGKKIQLEAVRLLQSRSGNSLRELMNEVRKLIDYVDDRDEITVEDVERLVGLSRSFNVFQLWDAIGNRNLAKSLLILRQMLETGERPVYLITSLTSYFVRLWKIRLMRHQGMKSSQIARELHIHPYFMDATVKQAMRFSDAELKQNMKMLLETDLFLKTGYLKPNLLLELLLIKMVGNKNRKQRI